MSTGRLNVSLKVGEAKALLECLTSGITPPQDVAKAVALAVVRAFNTGGGAGKGKKGSSKGGGLGFTGGKTGSPKMTSTAGRRY
jgi:hypothetical protein